MAHAGAELEHLVALIELVLGGPVVEIESPARLPGQLSGSMREVDVVATATVGSSRVRVILETRDHRRRQGPSWVEQVGAKRRDVAADVAIAVSSSGFTTGAEELAARERIHLRSVTPLSATDVVESLYWGPSEFNVLDDVALTVIPMTEPEVWSPLSMADAAYHDVATDQVLTEADVLTLLPDIVEQYGTVQEDAVELEVRLRNPRPDGFMVEVRTESQRFSVAELYVQLVVRFRREAPVISDAFEYRAPDGIAYAAYSATYASTGVSMPCVGQISGPPQDFDGDVLLLGTKQEDGRTRLSARSALDSLERSHDPRATSMIAFAASMCRTAKDPQLLMSFAPGDEATGV